MLPLMRRGGMTILVLSLPPWLCSLRRELSWTCCRRSSERGKRGALCSWRAARRELGAGAMFRISDEGGEKMQKQQLAMKRSFAA